MPTFAHYIDANVAFFHIAKTGGTSFNQFLRDSYSLDKLGVSRQRVDKEFRLEKLKTKKDLLGAAFDSIVIFTTIRNPYAQVVSFYFFLRDNIQKLGSAPPICPELIVASQVDFAQFVQWYCDNFPSYFEFIEIDGKIPSNVKILRIEEIVSELKPIVNDAMGLELDVDSFPHINVTGMGETYRDHFDRSLYDLVNAKQSWVFQEGFYTQE